MLLVAMAGAIVYYAVAYKQAEKEVGVLEAELKTKEEHEKALWDCIKDCNKKKSKGGECYCIQAEKKIRVY